ncbi:zinc-ribbon domain-containing protein [Parafrankia sp. FMc6]|uniref:zinc-ribbon domain-containing protein n=1 Tax=Parafrankia soli TaxID=2599596 RepID=UPI0034D71FD5
MTGCLRAQLPLTVRRSLREHTVAVELHPTKNEGLTPDEIPYSWKIKVWWRCSRDPEHEWDATVNNRTKPKSSGCPDCRGNHRRNGHVPLARSLHAKSPDVATELDAERSGFTAREVFNSATEVAWWRCPNGHPDYDMEVRLRTHASRPQGCPYCARKRLAFEDSLAVVAPELAKQFLTSVNGVSPAEIFSQDNRRYIWQCDQVSGHRWAASPNNRVGKGSGCPFCSGARVWELNRLSDVLPDLAKQWDQERNGALSPGDVSVGSRRKVHWRCPKGDDHRWRAVVYKRAAGQGCRFCAGHEASASTSLLARLPNIAAQLDATKSGISAAELTAASNQRVWWICPMDENHTWRAKVLARTLGNTGCPHCYLPGTSTQEIRLAAELSTVLPIALDQHTVQTATRIERVDIYAPELSLILEFDGSYWHEGREMQDAAKSRRLAGVADFVIRIREDPLNPVDPALDIIVPLRAPAREAAEIVLEHLAALGVVQNDIVARYRNVSPRDGAEIADAILARLRGKRGLRNVRKD